MALAARNNLPKLPGLTFGEEMHRDKFHKPHMLVHKDQGAKLPTPADVAEFGTWDLDGAKDTTFWQTTSKRTSERVWGTDAERDLLSSGSGKPVSLERKVLRFRAFFREPVHESPVEVFRTRIVFVHYYLEDDTIAVSEPKQDNSGIAGQGSFIKRHQIPKPDGSDIYTYEDFNIDVDVCLYGRVFRIVDCDAFTRRFLEQLGREVPSSMDIPMDQYTITRKTAREAMSARKQKQGNDMDYGVQRSGITAAEIIKTQQFLAHDKEVLRFSCVWDDRENPHGDKRYFRLYYFLADDTIEIIEMEQVNGGRDPFPSFVKRKRIPKPQEGRYQSPVPGLFVQNNGVEYYTDSDLRIGARLKVFGREFVVYDCDTFTQDHLRTTFGVRDFTPVNINAAMPITTKKDAPPHNGFGTEEDSLNSWKYLVPSTKATRRSVKPELADVCLKFQLRFSSADAANSARRFVVTYYLSDNTLSIFEPGQPNAGLVGGKFLNRQKVRRVRPDGIPTGENIAAQDFFLGANVTINTHKFAVYGTDERTLVYMEEHPNEFLHSNLMLVLRRLRAHCTPSTFAHADADHNGTLDYCEFARLMEELALPLKEHEILTIMRHFDKNGDGRVSVRELQQALGST